MKPISVAIAHVLAQAKLVKSRADYDSLPQDVKDWCESIIKQHGDAK